jgi:hypothetical protein
MGCITITESDDDDDNDDDGDELTWKFHKIETVDLHQRL